MAPEPMAIGLTDWCNLRDRLERAESTLREMAAETGAGDERLVAKADGISLALSYMRDYETGFDSEVEP